MYNIWALMLKTAGVRIYTAIIGLFTVILTSRVLGPEGRGELVAINTWVTTFFTFAHLSLGQVVVHRASKIKGDNWVYGAFSSLLHYAFLASIFSLLIAILLYYLTSGEIFGEITMQVLIVGYLLLPLKIWDSYSNYILIALDKLNKYNIFRLIGTTTGVIFLILFLYLANWGVIGVLTSNIICQLIICVLSIRIFRKFFINTNILKENELKGYVKDGFKLHLNAIGTFFIAGTDILMINYYHGLSEAAYYELAVQLLFILMLLPEAASLVIYSKVSSLGVDEAWKINRKILIQVLICIVLFGFCLFFASNWFINLLFGNEFNSSANLFKMLIFSTIGMTFSKIMAPQWIGRGFFLSASILTLSFGILNLILNIFLIPSYGKEGAVYSTLIIYTLSILVNLGMAIYCQKKFVINKVGDI